MSTKAVSYLRTPSIADKDGASPFRQGTTIDGFAAARGLEVDSCWWDLDVKGADEIQTRPGFVAMLAYMEARGIKTIIVEINSRFARENLTQTLGLIFLVKHGIALLDASTGIVMTDLSDPFVKMMITVMGSFSGLEKDLLLAKLKRGRDRVIEKTGRCGGPELVPEAHRSLAQRLRAEGLSLRAIADRLHQAGFLAASGKPYRSGSVANMLTSKRRDALTRMQAA